ncbi:hypothetical protein LCGC14_0487650 [marine sediment metagenome]|uniref:VWFA domain-containing protein n=1 Tax=marine sediment metagenome TaxID=412755 RepID=A0A0F9S7H1_9ZZZZ
MPKPKNFTNKRLLVGIVLDRSSSMGTIKDVTISGTNEQFSALRDSDDAANTFVAFSTFNNQVTPVFHDGSKEKNPTLVPVTSLKDLTEADYRPSGMTAMFDGVSDMIDFLSAEAAHVDDVLVVVISDGAENASKTTSEKLASKVKELQDAGWNFTYIGANQDLTQVQAQLGFHSGNMLSFDANVDGSINMNATVANAMSTYTATRSHSIASGNTGRVTTHALYAMPDPDEGQELAVDSASGGDGDLVVESTTGGDDTAS